MESKKHILWADDEIDMLKPHILYLEKKGTWLHPSIQGKMRFISVMNNMWI